MKFETLSIHAGKTIDSSYGEVMTPIYLTSTFAFKGVNRPGPFDYTRSGNPTRKALEDCLAALEGGTRGFAFASGMAAESAVLDLLGPGDHIIVHDDLYGGTYRILTRIKKAQGVDVEFVNLRDIDALRRAIKKSTKAVWTETPTNPLMNILDLRAIAETARNSGITTVCDNTFLSPYFQRPLDLGIDIVVHSTTKYINGHSDVVGGAAVVRDKSLGEKIGFIQNAAGTGQAPFDCYLVLRGLKTLGLRMEGHNRNALQVARWLEGRPDVSAVLHPGLESHPQRDLALSQMTGFGGTFSFRVHAERDALRLLEGVRIFTLAESLGGVESLIEHPWSMTHASMPEDVRTAAGITPNLIRISVGLEHVDDLVEDLRQAFGRM
ncbi:MAG: hypothetical protein A2176_01335 [Spirochaetes bacterium RBG_13_51_14]|nr:MAG: hypothetical protein A2176_01335 [Spirochaetes bacterium RBG_13_51_14]